MNDFNDFRLCIIGFTLYTHIVRHSFNRTFYYVYINQCKSLKQF